MTRSGFSNGHSVTVSRRLHARHCPAQSVPPHYPLSCSRDVATRQGHTYRVDRQGPPRGAAGTVLGSGQGDSYCDMQARTMQNGDETGKLRQKGVLFQAICCQRWQRAVDRRVGGSRGRNGRGGSVTAHCKNYRISFKFYNSHYIYTGICRISIVPYIGVSVFILLGFKYVRGDFHRCEVWYAEAWKKVYFLHSVLHLSTQNMASFVNIFRVFMHDTVQF